MLLAFSSLYNFPSDLSLLLFILIYTQVHIVQRGAVRPLIEMLQSPDVQLREMSAFALGRLAQVITVSVLPAILIFIIINECQLEVLAFVLSEMVLLFCR